MMTKRKAATPKPVGKGPLAAWAACGGILVVLAFLFGTMVGDGGAASTTASASPATPSPAVNAQLQQSSAQPRMISPDEVPEHIRANTGLEPGTGTRAPVQISPALIDLGSVAMNQKIPATAEIINTGDEPVTIRSSRANCGCTAVDMAGTVIPAGGSVPLNATFDSQSTVGPRSAAITVLFEGYDEPVRVNISANVQG